MPSQSSLLTITLRWSDRTVSASSPAPCQLETFSCLYFKSAKSFTHHNSREFLPLHFPTAFVGSDVGAFALPHPLVCHTSFTQWKPPYSHKGQEWGSPSEWPCRRPQLCWSFFLAMHRARQTCQELITDVLSKGKKECFVAHQAVPTHAEAEKKNIMKAEPIPSLKSFHPPV